MLRLGYQLIQYGETKIKYKAITLYTSSIGGFKNGPFLISRVYVSVIQVKNMD